MKSVTKPAVIIYNFGRRSFIEGRDLTMFRNVNIEKALKREREKLRDREAMSLIFNAFEVLNDEVYHEREIRWRVSNSERYPTKMYFGLDQERIFNIKEIQNICVKYRLRFLGSEKFKPDLPYEVIQKLKHLESETGQKFDSFKIVAPAEAFQLEDCEKDPLFLINLGLDKYYFLHRWGNDLSWYRKIVCYPLRSLKSLFVTVFSFALILSLFVPTSFIESSVRGDALFARAAFFLWVFLSTSAVVTYVGLTLFKTSSSKAWNSPFFQKHF